jgi:hypothetical protein
MSCLYCEGCDFDFFLLLSIHMLAIAISDSATGFFLYFLFLVFAGLGSWLELVREP